MYGFICVVAINVLLLHYYCMIVLPSFVARTLLYKRFLLSRVLFFLLEVK